MRRLLLAALALSFITASSVMGQTQSPPTLRVVTEDPTLPSDLFYGNTRVKPLRLRPGTNQRITIDDSDFFVQQNYIDFLGRFPDPEGFTHWNNEITKCNGNAACIDFQRVNTSAAFFISIEFQKTGYYVYLFYRSTLGRIPRYAELMPDRQRVGSGVIVNAPGWEAKLEANKQAFADAWVTRSDFARYNSMTPEVFVDTLFANVGVTPNATDRTALVNELKAGGSRATVLRKIVENNSVQQSKEYNSAFVLMQYFGYLRRNPDDAPDGNLNGYNFWVKELNGEGAGRRDDYRNMVRAFILASEYRDRF